MWDQGKTKRISYAVRTCEKARYDYFGLSPKVLRRTLFSGGIFFFPNNAQVAAGERFVRCDVVKHDSSKVYPLAADPRFSKVTKDVAACMSARFKITACTAPHRFYPTAAVGLPVPRPRSGQETIAVARRCVAVTGRRPAADRPPCPGRAAGGRPRASGSATAATDPAARLHAADRSTDIGVCRAGV